MRLAGWHVDSFGVLRDVGLRGLPPGLVVLHGPNAAGKSTLLAFIQRTLFGYPHRNRQDVNHYEPTEGERRGGRLFIEPDEEGSRVGGEVIVERHDGTGLKVVHPDGTGDDEAALASLTGGCDAQLFNAVFAFDLDDLNSLERLTDDAVRDRLFSAGVRGAGRSARAVHDRLDAEVRELWTPRSRTAAIDQAQEELREVAARLDEARQVAAAYPVRLATESRHAEEVDRLDTEIRAAETAEQRAEAMLGAWPVWRRREEAAGELEATGPPPQVPAGALERHERLRAGLDDLAERIDHLDQERRQLVADRDAVTVEDGLVEVADEALALGQDRPAQRERIERLHTCTAELDRLETAQVRTFESLGGVWDEQRLGALDVPPEARSELRTLKVRLERAGQEVAEAEAAVARISASTELVRSRHAHAQVMLAEVEGDPPSPEEIEHDRERLTGLRAALSEAEAAASALQAVTHFQEHHGTPPRDWIVPLLGGLTVLMAVAGVLAAMANATAVMVVLAVAALALLGVAIAVRRSSSPQPDEDPAVLAHQRARLATSELAEPAQELGLPSSPTFADLERLAVELDRAERQRTEIDRRSATAEQAAAELAEAEPALERAVQARDQARGAEDELRRRWRTWCREHGLDPELDPTSAAELLEALDRVRERQERRDLLASEVGPLRATIRDFAARAARVLTTGGRDPVVDPATVDRDENSLPDQHELRRQLDEIRRLAVEVSADREHRAERDRLRRRIQKLDTEIATEHARRDRLVTERDELLAAAGVSDEPALRQAVEQVRTHAELQQRLEQAESDLVERFGTGEEADRRRAELADGDRDGWRSTLDEARRRREELRRDRDTALELLVEARRAREEVETSELIVELDQRRHLLLAQRDELVHRWRLARLARRLVAETLEGFERERQPGVLRRASEHFRQVTHGRHSAVVQRSDDLLVLDDRSRSWGVETLSRGTAEQLYLCLRLALAEDLASRQERLPFVMDDVLVNFDPERAREVAELLVSVAGERQLLYFTCHPHTVDLLRESGAAAIYDLPRGGGQPVRRAS